MEETKMKKKWTLAMAGVLAFSTLAVARPASEKDEKERIANAGKVMKEILDVPDNIPQDVLDKARCVVVLPSVVKAAFVVGGSYGRGVMVCRRGHDFAGPWGAPVMMGLGGGSVGFQIGGEATDFVILVMNDRGMSSMLHSKVNLGGDASIAAGPKGRTASAESDVTLRAEMLSYSRSRGAFAGVSLEGSTLRPDGGANEKLYSKGVPAAEVVEEGKRDTPPEGRELVERLQQPSPHLKK